MIMKYARTMLVVLSMVAIAVSSASAVTITSGSTVIGFDDFESNTTSSTVAAPDGTGDYDPDAATTGSWSTSETAADKVQVTSYGTPGAFEGSKYLRITAMSNHAYLGFSANQTTGTLHFETMVNTGQTGTDYSTAVGFQNSSSAWGPMVQFMSGGKITYYNGAFTDSGLTYTANVWKKLEIDWTIGSSTFDLTYDGTTVTGLASRGTAASMDRIRLSGNGLSHFDAVPEPATMSLLGIGGLLALVRRRRK